MPKPTDTEQFPYRFGMLPLKQLIVGEYQRPLTSFVDRIEATFDPALVGTIVVSQRKANQYAIMDGQTRVEGMRRVGITEAPCLIYTGLSTAQEADLFARFQTERRGMHSASRFNAEVIAGRPVQTHIARIVEDCGFLIGTNINTDSRLIAAVAALEYAYFGAATGKGKQPEAGVLVDTLVLIKRTWPKLPDLARGAIVIRGVAYFVATTQDLDEERFVTKVGKVQPSELGKRANALREGRGMTGNSPALFAEAIENLYRKR